LQEPATRRYAYGAVRWHEEMLPSDLSPLEMAVGLGTHHDGMTGTCKQHVSDDYTLRLATSFTLAEKAVGSAVASLLGVKLPPGVELAHCRLVNETKCNFTATLPPQTGFGVAVYNPLALGRSERIRIPVPSPNFTVTADGKPVATSAAVRAPPLGAEQYIDSDSYGETQPYELQFIAELPPLALRTFEVTPALMAGPAAAPLPGRVVENDLYSLAFGTNGTLETVTNKLSGAALPVHQDFFYYQACGILGEKAGPMNAGSACSGGGAAG
jgi:hypothetical protein